MVPERQRTSEYATLQDFIDRHQRLFILTGAGCSTDSGIPDYRDADGQWKRAQPVTYQAFMGEEKTRQRYWARSLVGWRLIRHAEPNGAHRALAELFLILAAVTTLAFPMALRKLIDGGLGVGRRRNRRGPTARG